LAPTLLLSPLLAAVASLASCAATAIPRGHPQADADAAGAKLVEAFDGGPLQEPLDTRGDGSIPAAPVQDAAPTHRAPPSAAEWLDVLVAREWWFATMKGCSRVRIARGPTCTRPAQRAFLEALGNKTVLVPAVTRRPVPDGGVGAQPVAVCISGFTVVASRLTEDVRSVPMLLDSQGGWIGSMVPTREECASEVAMWKNASETDRQ
jgi:hypothetical protein